MFCPVHASEQNTQLTDPRLAESERRYFWYEIDYGMPSIILWLFAVLLLKLDV